MFKTIKPELEIDRKISRTLRLLSVPCQLKGFEMIKTAIYLVVEDFNVIRKATELKEIIARIHDCHCGQVDRNIRHAIKVAWENRDEEMYKEVFKYTLKKQPVLSEFIATVAEYIRLNEGETK